MLFQKEHPELNVIEEIFPTTEEAVTKITTVFLKGALECSLKNSRQASRLLKLSKLVQPIGVSTSVFEEQLLTLLTEQESDDDNFVKSLVLAWCNSTSTDASIQMIGQLLTAMSLQLGRHQGDDENMHPNEQWTLIVEGR